MIRAYVGLGANLGDPQRQFDAALAELGRVPDTVLAGCSPRYWTAPVGEADQPEFLNAVAALDTTLSAHALLDELQRIERTLGRVRERARRWGPRRIDLDLLVFGDQRIDDEVLTVPHPRMHERAFVLRPLADLAPDLRIGGEETVRQRLARLPLAELRPAEAGAGADA